ncbi:hypothetical protein [Endozoicomonas sp. Mp262]|uniref:hypothetical protein n=1 Tax=Endozoicomonas sp. Mp262 TaxID=2919499 RepID=UPI0021DAF412
MSLEARVTTLEYKVDQLEQAFQKNNSILEATHGVVALILKEQRERFDKQEVFNQRQEAFNQTVNENFKQIELLIRQLHPNH